MRPAAPPIRFQNVSAIPLPVDGDDDFLSVYEEYTGSVCAANRYMEDTGEIVENYHLSGWRLWMQRGARVCILACQILTPVLFAAAFVLWLRDSVLTVLGRRSRDAVLNWVAVEQPALRVCPARGHARVRTLHDVPHTGQPRLSGGFLCAHPRVRRAAAHDFRACSGRRRHAPSAQTPCRCLRRAFPERFVLNRKKLMIPAEES